MGCVMRLYFARRVLLFIPTVVLLTALVFLFMRIIPGDPAQLILIGHTGAGAYNEETLEVLQRKLGTDRPFHVQYGNWMWDLLHGDLGTSYFRNVSVKGMLAVRLPVTLELTFIAMLISFILAVPLGIVSALNQNKIPDYIARVIAFTGVAMPTFVTGIVTIYVLVRFFNWLPPFDYVQIWEDPVKNLTQMIFPSLALGFFMMAFIARVTRSSILEVLREDYIRTARSKGLAESRVISLHALRNAFLPILTVTGWAFGILLGGTVIIEQIFLLPGMGRLLLDAVLERDYPVVQAEILVIAGLVMLLNLVIDLLYAWVDPRIRFA